jgi:hypothetical protein
MGVSRLEQETIITSNAAEDQADIYAADPVWILKLDKLCKENPEQFRMIETQKLGGKIISKRYVFPKELITIRTRKVKQNLTEEQREARRKQLDRIGGRS